METGRLVMLMAFALTICGCGKNTSTSAQSSVLPRDAIISLGIVKDVLPEMSQETATGQNETAVGNPTGTRSVTYATAPKRDSRRRWGALRRPDRERDTSGLRRHARESSQGYLAHPQAGRD